MYAPLILIAIAMLRFKSLGRSGDEVYHPQGECTPLRVVPARNKVIWFWAIALLLIGLIYSAIALGAPAMLLVVFIAFSVLLLLSAICPIRPASADSLCTLLFALATYLLAIHDHIHPTSAHRNFSDNELLIAFAVLGLGLPVLVGDLAMRAGRAYERKGIPPEWDQFS
jgi:hypothetical protein